MWGRCNSRSNSVIGGLRSSRSKSGLTVGGRFAEVCGRFRRSPSKSPPVGSGARGGGGGAGTSGGGSAITGGGAGGGALGGAGSGGGGVGGVGGVGCCAARAASICSCTRASSWRMIDGLFHAPAASTRNRPTVIGDGPPVPITSGDKLTDASAESSPCTP